MNYGRHCIDQQDIDAVVEVLQSDFLTQGPMVPRFEKALANYVGVAHAVCANSATSSLHAACAALEVNAQSRVWVSANTFVASANCALLLGAKVDLIDIDPETGNITPQTLQHKLDNTAEEDWPTHLIVVHFAGNSCDMKNIAGLVKASGCRIIEDASHALGAEYDGDKVGACRYSDVAVFSFHPVKMITSGEGGCAVTQQGDVAMRMRRFTSHNVVRESDELLAQGHVIDGDWFYLSQAAAPNYRMSDIHAALGLSQLHKLDGWVTKRRALAAYYDQCFAGSSLMPMKQSRLSSYHLYVVRLPEGAARKQVFRALRQADIGVQVHYIPLYRHPHLPKSVLPGCEKYYQQCLTLPLHVQLHQADLDRVVAQLEHVLKEYS